MYASMFREHGHQNPQVNMVDSTIKFLVLSSPEGRSISRNQIGNWEGVVLGGGF
jgi:hypothetical protein